MTIFLNQMEASTSEAFDALDQRAAERALMTLFKHYPGHEWSVVVEGGVMKIRSMNLSSNYGFVIRMDEMSPKDFDKKVMRAGGEVLERFGMVAGKMDIQVYQSLPRDLRGAPEKDTS